MTSPLTAEELKNILALTENGTDDLISTRSKVFQKLDIDVDELSVKQLIGLIETYPSLLRRPIILDEKRMQIGFNEDEIRAFLPREVSQTRTKKCYIESRNRIRKIKDMNKNYSYPLDFSWSTEEISSVLSFF